MSTSRWVLYGIGFLAELAAWAGCGATAFLFLKDAAAWQYAGLIAGVIVVGWGVFMAPKATMPLPMVAYYIVKAIIYVWAAVIWALLMPWVAVAFVAAVAVSEPALYRRRKEQRAAKPS